MAPWRVKADLHSLAYVAYVVDFLLKATGCTDLRFRSLFSPQAKTVPFVDKANVEFLGLHVRALSTSIQSGQRKLAETEVGSVKEHVVEHS